MGYCYCSLVEVEGGCECSEVMSFKIRTRLLKRRDEAVEVRNLLT